MRQAPGQQIEWLDRNAVLQALKVGLAGVLSLFVAQALRLQYPEWAPFTVMVLMMVHPHPGSIALKSLFRVVGTLVGAALGVWLVSDYISSPILFLSVTFLVMGVASYKLGQLSSAMAPYAYFLTGVTLVVVESTAITQPDNAWFVALSRAEETLVGIGAVLIVTPLFGVRHPRLEFLQLARSTVDQLQQLTHAELQNLKEGTGSNSQVMEGQTVVLRKLLALDSLLLSERRESLYFRANIAILQKVRNSLRIIFQAVSELTRFTLYWKALDGPFRKQLEAAQDLLKQGFANVGRTSVEDPSILAAAFQRLDDEINHWLRAGELQELPADQLVAYLRCWNAFRRIQDELVSLYDLPKQFRCAEQDTALESHPAKTQPKIDRRLVIVGVKGGLVTVVSLFLLEWLHLPGASFTPVAAWLAVIFTSYQIPSGRPGHIRAFRNLLLMALYGIVTVLALLVLTPFLSNYWFMNLILFCVLFAHGYFAAKTSGLAFWMLGTLFLVLILVGLDPQKPVSFTNIMNSYLGVITGFAVGVTISRVLWPRLPQRELKAAVTRFCETAKMVMAEKPAGSA
ncbi:MAG: FUSC family protein, partial [Verrucomicrobia bacterium]|nr:FUSC family protein [Verrucomicrobiota bacterium]